MESPLTGFDSRLISSTAFSTALSMPRFNAIGLAPAATVLTPSRKMACARTVAVVVPSPATSEVLEATSRTICAPMFSSESFSSISLATVTPSLVMVGEPNFFSITTLRPLGPSVTFTASASTLTPRSIACRDSSPCTICLAISHLSLNLVIFAPRGLEPREPRRFCRPAELLPASCPSLLVALRRLTGAFQNAEHFLFAHDEEFIAIDLDLCAGILAEQNAIASFDVQWEGLAFFVRFAAADGNYFAFLRL